MPGWTFANLDQLRAWVSQAHHEPTEEGSEQVLPGLIAALRADPLVGRYLARQAQDRNPRNTAPWHALAERLTMALTAASAPLAPDVVDFSELHIMDDRGPLTSALMLALRLLGADVYLWSSAMLDVAAAAPLPAHVIGRECLPQPYMFWSYETAYVVHDQPGEPEMNWLLLCDETGDDYGGISIIGDRCTQGKITLAGGFIPYGQRYPDDFPDPLHREAVGTILRRLAFINSPYVDVKQSYLDRGLRRELARAKATTTPDTSVGVVQLRRRLVEEMPSERRGEDAVAWRHQWWVSGHYRAQWYASRQSHHVIWIAPHLKGPADLPIKERVYAVVR